MQMLTADADCIYFVLLAACTEHCALTSVLWPEATASGSMTLGGPTGRALARQIKPLSAAAAAVGGRF